MEVKFVECYFSESTIRAEVFIDDQTCGFVSLTLDQWNTLREIEPESIAITSSEWEQIVKK